MAELKRSKRHRTNRNHISVKDSVICITAYSEHARKVQKDCVDRNSKSNANPLK